MVEITQVELDGRGLVYVQRRIADLGGYSEPMAALCSRLGALLSGRPGVVSALAPASASEQRLYAFEEGGLLPENLEMSRAIKAGGGVLLEIVSLNDEFAAALASALRNDPALAAITVDANVRRDDPTLSAFAETTFFVGDSVFHRIDGRTSPDGLMRALSASPIWENLVVVTSAAPDLDEARNADEAALANAASCAREITISAYDGESFLTWRC